MKKIIFILSIITILGLTGCNDKKEIETIYTKGTIISNEEIADGVYKNVIELENGEIWVDESNTKIEVTEEHQHISKGDPKDVPNVVIICIEGSNEEKKME